MATSSTMLNLPLTYSPGITALTGDVTATGPGSVAGTVNSVLGLVPHVDNLANSLVKRDASSSFSVTKIYFPGSVSNVAIDLTDKVLYGAPTVPSVNFGERQLARNSGPVLDWQNSQLLTGAGDTSVDWEALHLKNGSTTTVDWQNAQLLTSGGGLSVDWEARQLKYESITAMDWGQRSLNDSAGLTSVDFQNRVIIDGNGNSRLSWSGSSVSLPGCPTGSGTNLVIDGSSNILVDTSSLRFKSDVQSAPSFQGNLQAKTYVRKEGSGKRELGLIAEEVAAVFPEMVNLDPEGLPFSINHGAALAILFAKIAELENKISGMKL